MNHNPTNKTHFSPDFWKSYEACDPRLWTGRNPESDLEPQYWYQAVRSIDLRDEQEPWNDPGQDHLTPLVLLGYACDEGVFRNQGRTGAQRGPAALRSALARLAYHGRTRKIWDMGDLHCVEDRMEECQESLAELVAILWTEGYSPWVIGGGHDMAYGHFKGFLRGLERRGIGSPRLGILNLDAHFDLRKPEPQPHSGSPFYQILEEFGERVSYTVLGIRRSSNTPELFVRAWEWDVAFWEYRDCLRLNWDDIANSLRKRLTGLDAIYLTIDLDGFSSAYAPGVSAASPMGLSPDFALQVLDITFGLGVPVALDIAELNPEYDRDESTAKLGALLLDHAFGLMQR